LPTGLSPLPTFSVSKVSNVIDALHFPRSPEHQVTLSCGALPFLVRMPHCALKENRIEQLAHIQVPATPRTIKLPNDYDVHGISPTVRLE
jgi:hypothetical protein